MSSKRRRTGNRILCGNDRLFPELALWLGGEGSALTDVVAARMEVDQVFAERALLPLLFFSKLQCFLEFHVFLRASFPGMIRLLAAGASPATALRTGCLVSSDLLTPNEGRTFGTVAINPIVRLHFCFPKFV